MPKKFIKRLMPNHETVRNHRHLKVFGKLLHDPNLFHLNRRSASGAFAVGLFCAFVPFPGQMILAAAAAIVFRVNLPLSVALVWLTNPITIPPMFYGAYRLGAWLMSREIQESDSELSMEWLANEMEQIWEPLLLGSFILGTISAILGYLTIRGLWRLYIISHIKERKLRRAQRKENSNISGSN